MRTILLLVISLCLTTAVVAQLTIVKNGKATGRIVVDQRSATDLQAAKLLNSFIKKITGTSLPVVSPGVKTMAGDLYIESKPGQDVPGIHEDGFRFMSDHSAFRITGAKGSGTV